MDKVKEIEDGGNCLPGFNDTGYGYCIQNDENTALKWYEAADYCADQHDARLCSPSEWYIACANNKAINMTGNREMVDEWIYPELSDYNAYYLTVGESTCESYHNSSIGTHTDVFRCCR